MITDLRFIERGGKKILQVRRKIPISSNEGGQYFFTWEDVPFTPTTPAAE